MISRFLPSLESRAIFYGLLGILAALSFADVVLGLSLILMGIPALICVVSFYLFFYLPLLDWPYLAWRYSGNWLAATGALALALLLPFGFPLAINSQLDGSRQNSFQLLPDRPVNAHNVLIVGEGRVSGSSSCSEVCQAFLWSGASDHILARQSAGFGQHLDDATLYTIERSSMCRPVDGDDPQKSRNGFCIVGRQVTNPSFDAFMQVTSSFNSSTHRLPFGVLEHQLPDFLNLLVYDCRSDCILIGNVTREPGERLAMPVSLHFEGGLDTGGPFGLFFARRPFASHPLAATIRSALGLDISGFAPRAGFSGDISHGGPQTPDPTAQLIHRTSIPQPEDFSVKMCADLEAAIPAQRRSASHEQRCRAIMKDHKDCPAPIIRDGEFIRCDG